MTHCQNYLKKVLDDSSAIMASKAIMANDQLCPPPMFNKRPTPYLLWDDNIVPIHLTAHPASSSCFEPKVSLPSTFSCCRLLLVLIVVFALIGVVVVIAMAAYLGVMTANVMDEVTNSQNIIGRLKVTSGDDYTKELENTTSFLFLNKSNQYKMMIEALLNGSVLKETYKGLKVIQFRPGSLIVFFRLILDRRKSEIQLGKWNNISYAIKELIKTEISNVAKNITIDLESIAIWEMNVSKTLQNEQSSNATLTVASTKQKSTNVTLGQSTKKKEKPQEDVTTTNVNAETSLRTESFTTTKAATTVIAPPTTTIVDTLPRTTAKTVTIVNTASPTTTIAPVPTTKINVTTTRHVDNTTRKNIMALPETQKSSLHAEALMSGVAHEIPFSLDDFLFNRGEVKEQRVLSSPVQNHPMETNIGAFLVLKTLASNNTSPRPQGDNVKASSNPLVLPQSNHKHIQQPFWIDSIPEMVVQSGTRIFKDPRNAEVKEQRLPFSASHSEYTEANVTDHMRMFSDTISLQNTKEKENSKTNSNTTFNTTSEMITGSDVESSSQRYKEENVMAAKLQLNYSTVFNTSPLLSLSAISDDQILVSCPNLSDFRCRYGGCVSNFSRCNQVKDCLDNSDEEGCSCADYLQAQYLQSKICDGVIDCWDYSDENRCHGCSPAMFLCQNSNVCISPNQICDSILDCPFGDDEKHCLELSINASGRMRDSHYRSSGYLLMRKNGQWGQLCVDNFPKHAIRTGATQALPVSLTELAKSVCRAITYEDFVTIERKRLPMYPRLRGTKEVFYDINYPLSDVNSSGPLLQFSESQCRKREVVWIQCKQLECGMRPVAAQARIVGGGNSMAGSWPWQTAMYKNGDYMCGATLLNDQWLLSAAHCFFNEVDNYWTARLGMLRRGSQAPYEQIYPISHIIIHPQYIKAGFINDVALLRLQTTVKFSDYVRPVCSPSPNVENIINGRMCTVVGWGQLQETGHIFPDTLQEVDLPIFDADECRKKTLFLQNYQITNNMFCAGFDRGGRDACLGDSGGPVVCQEPNGKWILVGITSNGFGCARPYRPGLYTKVANYITWMNQIMANPLRTLITRSHSHCPDHRCQLGKCLSAESVCNGYVECLDGSDERNCNS